MAFGECTNLQYILSNRRQVSFVVNQVHEERVGDRTRVPFCASTDSVGSYSYSNGGVGIERRTTVEGMKIFATKCYSYVRLVLIF
jgi:hypothetical protein